MVQTLKKIFNSTFDENRMLSMEKQSFWNSDSSCNSLSSIEKSFDPTQIKKIVDSLVFSKYGLKYREKCYKSIKRLASRNSSSYSSSLESCYEDMDFNTNSSETTSDRSVSTYNLSDLISNMYRNSAVSINNVVKLFTRSSARDLNLESKTPNEEYEYYFYSNLENVHSRLKELSTNKQQILKAIDCHKSLNKFSFDEERLEAERLLLVTDLQTELINCTTVDFSQKDSPIYYYSGSVEISKVRFWPEKNVESDLRFICLITNDCQVFSTNISKLKSNGSVHFEKKFLVENLRPDFKLNVKFYSISLKMLRKLSKPNLFCKSSKQDFNFQESLFSLWGETSIRLSTIRGKENLKIKLKNGLFTACVSSRACLNINISGFLDVTQNSAYPLWNRQWCNLSERFLTFFNYPPDDLPDSTPIYVLDVGICRDLKILSREECPRRNTLMIVINNRQKILLSCEDRTKFDAWTRHLKNVLAQIRIWEM